MLNNKLYKTINKYCANIDIPYQIDFVKRYAEIGDSKLYGGKHCGSSAEQAGAIEIEKQLKKLGLSNVKRVPVDTGYYQFNDATLKLINSDIEIKPYGYVSPGTEECGIEAEIVDVNKATKSDFKNRDVKGKIVLFAAMGSLDGGNLAGQMEEALLNEVAAMIIYAVEDVLDDETIRVQPPNIISTVPIVGICRKDAQIIKEMSSNNSCIGNLWVDAQFSPAGGTTYNVIGEIPGKLSEEKIIYTAHLDHYFRCLQDNISTCATLLGTAKAMIDSGYQPNRSIVFLFHGSHETGFMDSRYPYIYGSYKMAKLYESEFREKAIANLNFEYTALSQHCLQGLAYLCCNNIYKNYFPYSPELVGGFKIKNNNSPQSEYYIMSWADNISYLNIGVPSYLNDAITEQLYTGTSLYVGRDHSNKDNWEVFDEKTLEDVARFYGGLAIYIDALPFIDLDFTEYTNRIKREVDVEKILSLGVNMDSYFEAVGELEKAAGKCNLYLTEQNTKYINVYNAELSVDEKKQWHDFGRKFNKHMLKAFGIIFRETEKINAFDFLCLGSARALGNIVMLETALKYLNDDDFEKALTEGMAGVDLAGASMHFSESVAEHMRKQICSPEFLDRRTWASDREVNIKTHYRIIEKLSNRENASVEIKKAIEEELESLKLAVKIEENAFILATTELKKATGK